MKENNCRYTLKVYNTCTCTSVCYLVTYQTHCKESECQITSAIWLQSVGPQNQCFKRLLPRRVIVPKGNCSEVSMRVVISNPNPNPNHNLNHNNEATGAITLQSYVTSEQLP